MTLILFKVLIMALIDRACHILSHLTFSDQISSLSKSCYSHIPQLRCIRPYFDSKTASTIVASIVHSKLDYCNSLYYNLPKSQINRLQQIRNCLARTVVKAPKSSLVTPILRSLHRLKINERSEYKLLSLTYKVITTSQPDYLHNFISVQSSGRTRSSSVVTLARPSVFSSLQITNRSFRYASPHLWNRVTVKTVPVKTVLGKNVPGKKGLCNTLHFMGQSIHLFTHSFTLPRVQRQQ